MMEPVQERYTFTKDNMPREVVLLKSHKCKHRKCSFCDYWQDGTSDMKVLDEVNYPVLDMITGHNGVLEVINSGSIFELPESHLVRILEIIKEKNIHTFLFESHWMYREQAVDLRRQLEYSGVKTISKIGIETFDYHYRQDVLKKGMDVHSAFDVRRYFQGINLLVGLEGQNIDMVAKDIALALNLFEVIVINIFTPNSKIKRVNQVLIDQFYERFEWMREHPRVLLYDHKNAVGLG